MSVDLAIDFGTTTTRVADARGHLLFEQPTVAAVDDDTGRLVSFGAEAAALGPASAGRIRLVEPVAHGQLVDLDLAEEALEFVLERSGSSRMARRNAVVCVHLNTTPVQRRALERSLRRAGMRRIQFIEQPIADAVGAGLSIDEPDGRMIVDVGGGVTDVAVIALGGVVTEVAVARGGRDLVEATRRLLAQELDVIVSRAVAEEVLLTIGTLDRTADRSAVEVAGRSMATGEPRTAVVRSDALTEVLTEAVRPILGAAAQCLASAPPELGNDVLVGGIVLAGGASRLAGFDRCLAATASVPVHPASLGGQLAVVGAARCLATAFHDPTSPRGAAAFSPSLR